MAKEDPQMKIRLPIELKSKIQQVANTNNRSMNAEIAFILERYLQSRNIPNIMPKYEILEHIYEMKLNHLHRN